MNIKNTLKKYDDMTKRLEKVKNGDVSGFISKIKSMRDIKASEIGTKTLNK